jgi:putative autotransporter adhesin-like protein
VSTGPTPTDRHIGLKRLQVALMALGVLLLMALVIDRIFFDHASTPAGTGSGDAKIQARALPPFTAVDLAGAKNVIVHVGRRQSVIVHADNNLLRRVTTRVRAGRLVIGTTPGNLRARTPMFVAVSLPVLDGLKLEGAGNITATGTATKLDVTLSGAGNMFLSQLGARDAKAALSGDGSITLTATRSLAATLSGRGTVFYGGDPPYVTRTITGSGVISAQ